MINFKNSKGKKYFAGFIAIILGLIGCLVAWMKENKRNCYKEAGLIDNEEVISEIYIDDNIIHNEEIPQKHKKQINPNSSFYNNPYWEVYLIKHPLPKLIYEQITKLKEAQNKF